MPAGSCRPGDHISWDLLPNIPNPSEKTITEGLGVDQNEDSIEGVGPGYAARKGKAGAQPFLLAFGEPVDVLPTIGPTELGQNGDQQDVEEDMALPSDLPWVGKGGEMACKTFGFRPHGLVLHGMSCQK